VKTEALDESTVSVLREWRSRQLRDRMAFGSAWENTGPAFTKEDGNLIHPDLLTKHFDVLVRSSGVPLTRLHHLRHTHAASALQAGIHPTTVSERLGHATVAFTLDGYSHTIPAPEEAAAERIAQLVFDA
jgi:integrase